MRIRKFSMAAVVSVVLALSFAVATSTPANAATWVGPIDSRSECLREQNNYARYYRIVQECKYFASSGWYFTWEHR